MTVGFALDYLERKMKERRKCDSYLTMYRHIRVDPGGSELIKAHNQLFLLIDPDDSITVLSKTGVYDMDNEEIREQQYDHTGEITITNKTLQTTLVKFIQVIPKRQ